VLNLIFGFRGRAPEKKETVLPFFILELFAFVMFPFLSSLLRNLAPSSSNEPTLKKEWFAVK
jgi:bacteriorhodopsin